MARYVGGARSTAAATALLPQESIYANASVPLLIREIGVFNTTTTAVAVALCRLTTAGIQGAAVTEQPFNPESPANTATVVNSHTSTGPTLVNLGFRAPLAAAIGAGIIWTFDLKPLVVPKGTGNGVGIYTPTGTGQICDIYFVWDEGD